MMLADTMQILDLRRNYDPCHHQQTALCQKAKGLTFADLAALIGQSKLLPAKAGSF